MRFVEPRSLEQTDILVLHKLINRKVQARTALINQIRGFLNEYGVIVAPGKERLLKALPELLEDAENPLTCAAREALQSLLEEWREDRKSTRLNSSHVRISYAVFC